MAYYSYYSAMHHKSLIVNHASQWKPAEYFIVEAADFLTVTLFL